MCFGKVFVLGTIMGAAVVWLWGREIGGRSSLRRAEEFLQGAGDRVGETLRAGEKAIRPAPG